MVHDDGSSRLRSRPRGRARLATDGVKSDAASSSLRRSDRLPGHPATARPLLPLHPRREGAARRGKIPGPLFAISRTSLPSHREARLDPRLPRRGGRPAGHRRVDEWREQRLRNVFAIHPVSALRPGRGPAHGGPTPRDRLACLDAGPLARHVTREVAGVRTADDNGRTGASSMSSPPQSWCCSLGSAARPRGRRPPPPGGGAAAAVERKRQAPRPRGGGSGREASAGEADHERDDRTAAPTGAQCPVHGGPERLGARAALEEAPGSLGSISIGSPMQGARQR